MVHLERVIVARFDGRAKLYGKLGLDETPGVQRCDQRGAPEPCSLREERRHPLARDGSLGRIPKLFELRICERIDACRIVGTCGSELRIKLGLGALGCLNVARACIDGRNEGIVIGLRQGAGAIACLRISDCIERFRGCKAACEIGPFRIVLFRGNALGINPL